MHLHMRKDVSSKCTWTLLEFPLTQKCKILFYVKAKQETFVKCLRSAKGTVLDPVGVMLVYFYSGCTHTGRYIYLCLRIVSRQVQLGPRRCLPNPDA